MEIREKIRVEDSQGGHETAERMERRTVQRKVERKFERGKKMDEEEEETWMEERCKERGMAGRREWRIERRKNNGR